MVYRECKWFGGKEVTEPVRKTILQAMKAASNRVHGLADAIEAILPVKNRREAKTTSSVYFKLPDGTTIRVSNHSSGIWIGLNNRNNRADQIEINANWTAARLTVKLLSIKKCIGEV